jgi:hypothetical protein
MYKFITICRCLAQLGTSSEFLGRLNYLFMLGFWLIGKFFGGFLFSILDFVVNFWYLLLLYFAIYLSIICIFTLYNQQHPS